MKKLIMFLLVHVSPTAIFSQVEIKPQNKNMQEIKYNPCGGCGATTPIDRCIGCFHPFYPIETHEVVSWVNLKHYYTEDWEIKHCRYVSDKRKLDTDLFEEKDGGLVKKGGTGHLELHEVEYMVEATQPTGLFRLPQTGAEEV